MPVCQFVCLSIRAIWTACGLAPSHPSTNCCCIFT